MSTAPQFANTPNKGTPGSLTAANTSTAGTGATGRVLIFTAGASGSVLPTVRCMHLGTNVATLVRIFRNNGSDPEVSGNNCLIGEVALAANTVSQTSESISYSKPVSLVLAAGERVYCTLATAVVAGVMIVPINGGDL